MKTLFTVLMISFLWVGSAFADACGPFGCFFSPGTICVDGKCTPATTPTTSIPPQPPPVIPIPTAYDIRLEAVPFASIVPKEIDCTKVDLKNVHVYLTMKTLPGPCSFYSAVYYKSGDVTHFYTSHKDIMNRYVFTLLGKDDTIQPQFVGQDFAFLEWEDLAFREILQTMTCAELKKSGWTFLYGISIKGDFSDFNGAAFQMK